MKQPFAYYGGKQTIAPKIVSLLPDHTTYVEPFCGGASLFFAKNKLDTQYYNETLNDKNDLVVNFFRVLRDQGDELVKMLNLTPYSNKEFYEAKKIYANPENESNLKKAWAFFVACEQSFCHILTGGWGFGKNTGSKPSQFKNKVENLDTFISRLKRVHIDNQDVLKCLKRWDSPQTLFYLDPPYPATDQAFYSGFTQDNFKELLYSLKHCKSSFILSCYNNVDVPKNWEKFEFKKKCTVPNKEKYEPRIECVWRVDRSKNIENSKLKSDAQRFGKFLRGEI